MEAAWHTRDPLEKVLTRDPRVEPGAMGHVPRKEGRLEGSLVDCSAPLASRLFMSQSGPSEVSRLQGMGLPLCPDSVTRLESPPSETCVPFKNMAKDIREQSPRWLGACPCCCQTSEQLLQDAHGQLNGKIERFLCKIFVEIHAHVWFLKRYLENVYYQLCIDFKFFLHWSKHLFILFSVTFSKFPRISPFCTLSTESTWGWFQVIH